MFFGKRQERMMVAELPPEAMPKSKGAPGLVADVIVSKLVDHMPLYRQEKRHARQGVELSRSTLCGWFREAAAVLEPLYGLLKKRVLAESVLHTDDTPIPVQDSTRDGNLAIDNNVAERAVKPFAIGRKNWLFFGSDQGGNSLAILASFTATCQQFGINPWIYLRDTLTSLPTTPLESLHTLLPIKS